MSELPATRSLFVFLDGTKTGPYSETAVRGMAATGRLSAEDQVWEEGGVVWMSLRDVIPDQFPPRPLDFFTTSLVLGGGLAIGGVFSLREAYAIHTALLQKNAREIAGYYWGAQPTLFFYSYVCGAVVLFLMAIRVYRFFRVRR